MKLSEVLKNQKFFEELLEKKKANKFSNSVMFLCEDELTAKCILILTALMLEYDTFEMFDEDSTEFIRIQNGVDLDVKVYPKNLEKLLVADSNEIVYECFVKSVNLPKKIFIINNIDVSTDEAQNKLLKVLEEPPKDVYFLISAKSGEKVLPTIRSRCEQIKIAPFSMEEIEKVCSDELACILGEGWVGKTFSYAQNANLQNVTKFAVSLLTELKSSKQVVKFSKSLLELQAYMNIILRVFVIAIEDVIKLKCDREELCRLKPFLNDLKDVEPEFSVEALCEISKLVSNFLERLEFNANLTVAVDNLLLKMLEVKYLCK